MIISDSVAEALNLTNDDKMMFETPLAAFSKEGLQTLFRLADRVFDQINLEKENERKASDEMSEEEMIHSKKESMIPLKRNFY